MNIELGDNLRTWTIISVLLCILTVGVAVGHFVFPPETTKQAERRGNLTVERAKKDLLNSEEKLAALKQGDPAIWEGQTEAVTPQVLQTVTVIAKSQGVNLKSFRPQNPVSDGNLARANFVVLVDGTFPQVVEFIKSLDAPTSRLGVSLVQVSSVDQESDIVNATIGIVAYVKLPDPKEKTEAGKANTDKTADKTAKDASNSGKPLNDKAANTSQQKEQKRTDGTKE